MLATIVAWSASCTCRPRRTTSSARTTATACSTGAITHARLRQGPRLRNLAPPREARRSAGTVRHLSGFCGPGVPAALSQTTWCAEMAQRFVAEKRDRPWLLSINFFDPHPPFDAPADSSRKSTPRRCRCRSGGPATPSAGGISRPWTSSRPSRTTPTAPLRAAARIRSFGAPPFASAVPDTFDALAVKANYYAMIQQIDAEVGRIIEAFDAPGSWRTPSSSITPIMASFLAITA